MSAGTRKIVVLGIMTRMPVPGVIWQTVHYLIGFQRLGYDVYYVEDHARAPRPLMTSGADDGATIAASFIAGTLRRFDLGDKWAYRALHSDGRCYGLSEEQLYSLYRSAHLIVNLSGGTKPRPEHTATGRLVYLETDPVKLQIQLHENVPGVREMLAEHCAIFSFAENYAAADCRLPVARGVTFRPTRQPVVLDLWCFRRDGFPGSFTTVASWDQWRTVTYLGEKYTWNKRNEFLKFLDLPRRTGGRFELALSNCDAEDRRMLKEKGWKVVDAPTASGDVDVYRQYIGESRAEFTVAKDQNVRLRSGWFSDRSATYLAAGRPVVTQDTGFGNILPTGAGLFAFSTLEEAADAIERINADYHDHCSAAETIAAEYFNSDIVLAQILSNVGM